MADAPEVVPTLSRSLSNAPEVVSPTSNAPEVIPTPDVASSIPLPSSPSPPYSGLSSPDIKRKATDISAHLSEKSGAISPAPLPDKITPKYLMEDDQTGDRSTAKYVVEEEGVDNREPEDNAMMCRPIHPNTVVSSGARGIDDAPPYRENNQTGGNRNGKESWHFGFWDICGDASLCCEAVTCPCILAGRTHLRVKGTKESEITSTNMFCFSCCICTTLLFFSYWMFTSTTRREVRYRYGIQGSNRGDCAKAAFCCCCACIQEERETRWREEKWTQEAADLGYSRRNEEMRYVAEQ